MTVLLLLALGWLAYTATGVVIAAVSLFKAVTACD